MANRHKHTYIREHTKQKYIHICMLTKIYEHKHVAYLHIYIHNIL